MDNAVGTVVAALEELEIADRTIVLCTSDNGGLSTSEGHPASNLPLRAGKGWIYEGGIRVPTIISWPGVTEPGSVSDVPLSSQDFFLTMLDMAGLPLRPEHHLDGVSLVPVLRLELYDLAEDLGEQHDRVDQQPARARAMHQRLKAWREEVGARYPTTNPDYDAETGRRDRQL